MSETRVAYSVPIAVCPNGHVAGAAGEPREGIQVRHRCGEWTWAQSPFCQQCGGRVDDADVTPEELAYMRAWHAAAQGTV